MGKCFVSVSFAAALLAWPVWGQEDGPASEGPGESPPVAQAPVVQAPVVQAPVADVPLADAPVVNDPASADPAADDLAPQVAQDPVDDPVEVVVEEPPALDPILPIGDEPVAVADADPDAAPDPDNSIGACRDDTLYVRGDFGKARFSVDVAKTAEDRAQGLMHVEKMPTSKGMLFVYPAPQPVAFWMKNTLIPLDMIFADGRGVVVKVHDSAIPGDLTSIPGGDQVQFVLEINGGLAGMMGITEGAELRHPTVRRAAWPC